MGMGPLTEILPRSTTVQLGGKDYQVGEFRLVDLAEMQKFLDDRHGDPIKEHRAHLESNGIEGIEKELALAYQAFDQPYPFVYGEYRPRKSSERFDLEVEFVRVALNRHHPVMTTDRAKAIIDSSNPGEISALRKAAWGRHPIDEIGVLLGMEHRRERSQITWAKAICEVAELRGWTFEYIYSLTLSEFWFVRANGEPKKVGNWRIRGSMKEAAEERRNWWNRLMGR